MEQIKDSFPKRSLGSLQGRYCLKLNARPVAQKKRGGLLGGRIDGDNSAVLFSLKFYFLP